MVFLTQLFFLLALVVWVGGALFFSLVVAPSLFKALPPEFAGKAVGAIFPKYYPIGYLSGIVALLCALIGSVKTGHWAPLKMLILLVMTGLALYSSLITHPKARTLKEEMQSETGKTDITLLKSEFDHVHRVSVIHNGIILVLGVLLIVLTARGLTL